MKIKKTKPVGDMKRFLDAKKVDTVVLGPVERTLLARPADHDFRREDILHPSEMSKLDTCDLAVYYRLIGATPLVPVDKTRFQLQRIFDEGHEIHAKWQGYLAEAKLLEGIWECPSTTCGHRWWDIAPVACVRCNHVGRNQGKYTNMIYKEVPLDAEQSHLIVGHADGKIGKRILEIKSIGAGTIRLEAPGLLAQHTYQTKSVLTEDGEEFYDGNVKTFIDWDGLWKGIKRPLNSHQRQAHLYTALARLQGIDVEGVVFLYECKWNQTAKEFVVPYNEKFAEPMLEKALDLKYAVEKRRPPRCPHGGCKECERYEGHNKEHSGDEGRADAQEHEDRDGRSQRGGDSPAGEAGAGAADAADRPHPARTRQPLGAGRRPADGAVRPTDRVGRLPLGAARRG